MYYAPRVLLKIAASCILSLGLYPQQARAQADSGFAQIPAGTYTVGQKGHKLNPLRQVTVAAYRIATTEITNQQFEQFVTATHYRTDAERMKNAMVFEPGLEEFQWLQDSTAYWRYPNGTSRGGIENKGEHPVTTISYGDIQAYCNWAGVRLPSFEEWEIAARAGSPDLYFWGAEKETIKDYANIWYGRNHLIADSTDGYMYTAPVASFKPNAYGLYDVYGNVFEFCEGRLPTDPKGRNIAHARGGSWWCSKNACSFFNSADIGRVSPHASFSNQGFRVVLLNKQ
jgi:sulfatase modifying factor 1